MSASLSPRAGSRPPGWRCPLVHGVVERCVWLELVQRPAGFELAQGERRRLQRQCGLREGRLLRSPAPARGAHDSEDLRHRDAVRRQQTVAAAVILQRHRVRLAIGLDVPRRVKQARQHPRLLPRLLSGRRPPKAIMLRRRHPCWRLRICQPRFVLVVVAETNLLATDLDCRALTV
jgi:hypothetical protein